VAGRYAFQQSAAEFAPWMQFTNVSDANTGTWLSLEQGSLTLKAASSLTREFRLEATTTGFFGGTRDDDQVDTGDTMALAHRDLHYFGAEGTVEGILQATDTMRLVLGVEASADREHLGAPDYRSRADGSPVAGAGTAEDFETTLLNIAGRAQLTWDLVPKYLVPTAGVRVDHNSVYGDRVSGRLAVVSNVFSEFYLKGSYGTAFKAATPLLLYGRPLTIGDVIGSSALGPQELRSLEFTADYRPKSIVDLELTVTHWDLLDRAVFRPEQINLIARNAADGNGWTVEGTATTRFSDAVGGSLGVEWVRVTQESGEDGYRGELFGNTASIYPDFIVRGRVWSRVGKAPLEVWLATNVVGPRNASDMNTLEAAERYVLPTYATLDAGMRTLDLHFIGDKLSEFMLRGQNILDSAGASAGYFGIDYPAAPPRVQLEFRQEL
jgi:iron complex outermembrane receptor protein